MDCDNNCEECYYENICPDSHDDEVKVTEDKAQKIEKQQREYKNNARTSRL